MMGAGKENTEAECWKKRIADLEAEVAEQAKRLGAMRNSFTESSTDRERRIEAEVEQLLKRARCVGLCDYFKSCVASAG